MNGKYMKVTSLEQIVFFSFQPSLEDKEAKRFYEVSKGIKFGRNCGSA